MNAIYYDWILFRATRCKGKSRWHQVGLPFNIIVSAMNCYFCIITFRIQKSRTIINTIIINRQIAASINI